VDLHYSRAGIDHLNEIKEGIAKIAPDMLFKVDGFMHVRIYVSNSTDADEKILQHARGMCGWFETISVREPTLEDVFLKVAGVSFEREGTMTFRSLSTMFERFLGGK
jgi:cysteinyl-tRNA synthetase